LSAYFLPLADIRQKIKIDENLTIPSILDKKYFVEEIDDF
jgi:hypothetical protein